MSVRRFHPCKFFIVAALFLTTGCIKTVNEFRVVGDANPPAPPPQFNGLKALFDTHDYDSVSVMLVHGMGGYAVYGKKKNGKNPPADDKIVPAFLREALGFDKLVSTGHKNLYYPPKDVSALEDGPWKKPDAPTSDWVGYLKGKRYTRADGKTLTIFTLHWDVSVRNAKTQLTNDDDQSWVRETRLKTYTDKAKLFLMDELLADAILYTGIKHKQINSAFSQASALVHKVSPKTNHANAVIAFSLGSAIASDALSLPTAQSLDGFKANLCKVYFLANQIPLLNLGIDEDRANTAYRAYTDNLIDTPRCRANEKMPWVVSFSDPNDVLSYPIAETVRTAPDNAYTFADVAITMADRAYWPFVWVIDPLKAHIRYGSHPRLREMIIDGYQP